MDNGLIFPYPRRSAHDQTVCANPRSFWILRVKGMDRGSWVGVVKRWGDVGG
jgi:hypothetical protein